MVGQDSVLLSKQKYPHDSSVCHHLLLYFELSHFKAMRNHLFLLLSYKLLLLYLFKMTPRWLWLYLHCCCNYFVDSDNLILITIYLVMSISVSFFCIPFSILANLVGEIVWIIFQIKEKCFLTDVRKTAYFFQ